MPWGACTYDIHNIFFYALTPSPLSSISLLSDQIGCRVGFGNCFLAYLGSTQIQYLYCNVPFNTQKTVNKIYYLDYLVKNLVNLLTPLSPYRGCHLYMLPCARDGGGCGCAQVGDLEDEAHVRGQGDPLVACQGQDLGVQSHMTSSMN